MCPCLPICPALPLPFALPNAAQYSSFAHREAWSNARHAGWVTTAMPLSAILGPPAPGIGPAVGGAGGCGGNNLVTE